MASKFDKTVNYLAQLTLKESPQRRGVVNNFVNTWRDSQAQDVYTIRDRNLIFRMYGVPNIDKRRIGTVEDILSQKPPATVWLVFEKPDGKKYEMGVTPAQDSGKPKLILREAGGATINELDIKEFKNNFKPENDINPEKSNELMMQFLEEVANIKTFTDDIVKSEEFSRR